MSFNVALPAGADFSQAREALLATISPEPGVLRTPPPDVFLSGLNEGAAVATCRLWAARGEVGPVQRAALAAAERALEGRGLGPTQLQPTVPADTDPSRLL